MTPPVVVAITGYGVAGQLHAQLAASRPDLTIAAIVDPDPARRRQARHDHPTAIALPHLSAVRSPVDLVVIASPPNSHDDDTRAAIVDHNAHVLCEKPAVLDIDSGRLTHQLAHAQGLLLTPVHNYLHSPTIRRIHHLIDTNTLGTLTRITIDITRTQPSTAHSPWRSTPAHGAGILNDHGPHALYLTHHLTGHPTNTVSCTTSGPPQAEHSAALQLTLTDTGTTANITMTWNGQQRRTRLHIHGTRATLALDAGHLTIRTGNIERHEPADNLADPGHTHTTWTHALHTDTIARINHTPTHADTWHDALIVAETLNAARLSAKHNGRTIPLTNN